MNINVRFKQYNIVHNLVNERYYAIHIIDINESL